MESPHRQFGSELTYALLLWTVSFFEAQSSMVMLWYNRRCYERVRGELIMMIYEKVLVRKVIVGQEEIKSPPPPEASGSKGSAEEFDPTSGAKVNGDARNGDESPEGPPDEEAVNAPTPIIQADGEGPEQSNRPLKAPLKPDEVPPGGLAAKLNLFRDLFSGSKEAQANTQKKGPASTGQVLNLVSADAYEIASRFVELDSLIKTPFGFIFSTLLICWLLGPSCLMAVAVIVVGCIGTAILTKIQAKWRRFNKKATDQRVQVNGQFIESLRHLRWYGWQEPWLGKVMNARQHELNVRIISMTINLIIYFTTILSSGTFPVFAFFAYTYLAGHTLSIALIFPARQLFSNMNQHLNKLPNLIFSLTNAWVAVERIENFMREPEKDGDVNESETSSDSERTVAKPTFKLQNCDFSWPGSLPVLHNVTLTLGSGITAVYGKIGSGKTALLHAILGELDKTGGIACVPDVRMGYCAQTPWLQSMSIRDNILFFTEFEEARYQKVLDACELVEDMKSFKDGDRSNIGEK
jgi:ABC-type multidrug transport system fused ATPase/permease subunit